MTAREPSTNVAVLARAAKRAPMLGAEEEVRYALAAQAGDQAAFDRLLHAHLRLVLTIAGEFRAHGLPFEDLVSEGVLGLTEAARRFEPARGVRLAAYAAWWIRAYIRRYTIANRRIVRAPSTRHGRKLLANLRRTQRELAQQCGEQPGAGAVAEALGVAVSEVEEMEAALSGRDIPCGPDLDGRGYYEPIAGGSSPEAEVAELEERVRAARAVRDAMQTLTPRERRILKHRYLTDDRHSLSSIGRGLGLSRERVRQLEQQAQHKMRQAMSAVA